MGTIYWYVMIM